MTLTYAQIQDQLVEHLPEIAPAAENYWQVDGSPGEDCGAYIFVEDMFAKYVEVLLHLPSAPIRDRLLLRAFGFVDLMLTSKDTDVSNLGYIGLLEGREAWWLMQSRRFLGPAARQALDQYYSNWRAEIKGPCPVPTREIIDRYNVRGVVAKELHIPLASVPGRTHFKRK